MFVKCHFRFVSVKNVYVNMLIIVILVFFSSPPGNLLLREAWGALTSFYEGRVLENWG